MPFPKMGTLGSNEKYPTHTYYTFYYKEKTNASLLVSSSVCLAQNVAPTESFVDNISISDTFTLVTYKGGALVNADTTSRSRISFYLIRVPGNL